MKNLWINNTGLLFRNFSGEVSKYNTMGDRTFSVIIPTYAAPEKLIKDGWNIKTFHSHHTTDGEPIYYLNVTVKNDPEWVGPQISKIFVYTDENEIYLNSGDVGFLDYIKIKSVDVVLHPYQWNFNGKSGIKAYLKRMIIRIDYNGKCMDYIDNLKNVLGLHSPSKEQFQKIQKGNDTNMNGLIDALNNLTEAFIGGAVSSYMSIKDVIFNDPATIVMWSDGSKTVVRVAEGETFDPEKGLAMAISKKHFGNCGNYYNCFKKWLPKGEGEKNGNTIL